MSFVKKINNNNNNNNNNNCSDNNNNKHVPEARLFHLEIDTPGMKWREHFVVIFEEIKEREKIRRLGQESSTWSVFEAD